MVPSQLVNSMPALWLFRGPVLHFFARPRDPCEGLPYKTSSQKGVGVIKIPPIYVKIVQTCAEKRDCFAKHQPGVAGCGWVQPGRNFLST